jgi:hypothetical protein
MKTLLINLVLLSTLQIGFSARLQAQANATVLANADTSGFSPTQTGGWQLVNSYVGALGTDSAQLELIVQNSSSVDWSQLQPLGVIKGSALFPSNPASLIFSILGNQYQLNIGSDGRCGIKLVNGGPPSGIPVVIPLRVNYKL